MVELESQKKWKNRTILIDKVQIESNEYWRKFDQITEDKDFSRLLYYCAK